MDENEGLDAAARRELEEETGVTNCAMVQTGAYGGFCFPWEIAGDGNSLLNSPQFSWNFRPELLSR